MGYAVLHKAVFLDRDGTINTEKNYLYRMEDFTWIEGAVAALQLLQEAGYKLIIITNQSGIARGYYSDTDFWRLTDWMLDTLARQDIKISGIYYCPHLENAPVEQYRLSCDCRKPKLGLFYKAAQENHINFARSYVVGDKMRDLSICFHTACKGYLIANNEEADVVETVIKGEFNGITWKRDLLDAAQDIVFHDRQAKGKGIIKKGRAEI